MSRKISPDRAATSGTVHEALRAVARLRDLLVDGRKLPVYVADLAADDLATIEATLRRSVDPVDRRPRHIHRPGQMPRAD